MADLLPVLINMLGALTTPSADDLVYMVDDPGGTPTGKKVTVAQLFTLAEALNIIVGTTTGTKIGTGTDQKLGFWNKTPIIQPAGATQAAPAAYGTGAYGLDTDAHMQALYDLVVAMRTALVNAGIMKGAA
jgi:hypothetical protein